MSEKTTSEFMLEIASHYLMNGCDDCPFYDVTKTCDSKPINCTWMVLRNYFKAEESKEESESAEPERKWIPVTERLPKKENKSYWICTDTKHQCECRWTNNIYGIGKSNNWGWSIFDIPQYTRVIAWMPLPEPWRGDR